MIRLDHRFRVPLPAERVWAVLVDPHTVAWCLPDAGVVELDDIEHRVVVEVRAEGGNGSTLITVALEPEGDATQVGIHTGRGTGGRVALDEFAHSVEQVIVAGTPDQARGGECAAPDIPTQALPPRSWRPVVPGAVVAGAVAVGAVLAGIVLARLRALRMRGGRGR